MNNIFRFIDFPVYKAAKKLRRELKKLSKEKFPKEEIYGLRAQLWRALDSILFNIAEGSERYSDVDFSRFLNNSITSLIEVVACLDAALDDKYITINDFNYYSPSCENVYKQLRAFASKVRKDNKKN